jgi:hypothetical protein
MKNHETLLREIEITPLENWKDRNSLLKNLLRLIESEEDGGEDPVSLCYHLISQTQQASLKVFIIGYLRQYDPKGARKVLEELQDADPMAWLLLSNWENDQINIEKKNVERIERFRKLHKK